uniref:MalT-like TPR region domain-containing protein n=1 Tax=Alexandrium monilatum TaxID=311494 RepID=A0A7S4UFQ1_9DINO
MAGVTPSEADGGLYGMQPLLRLHLRQQQSTEGGGANTLGGLADPETAARLLAGYAGRIASSLVRREEFPNVQLVLDLAGATCSFLALLWAVRSIGWVHTWLGDLRRVKLYERALAVLASLAAQAETGAPAGLNTSEPPPPKLAWAEEETPAGPRAAELPSDVLLATPAGGNPKSARMEACMRRMVQQGGPYRSDRPWGEQQDWIFVHGSNINPAEVWGAAIDDDSQPLLRPHGDLDERALPMMSKSHTALCTVVSAMSSPEGQQLRIHEAMLELAAACRATDAGRALRLAHCVVMRLCHQHSLDLKGTSDVPHVADMSTELQSLLADALVEFALGSLSFCGLSSRALTTDLIDLAVSIGQRSDPTRLQHFRTLRLASFHALAFERDPCKAERLLKRCLEQKLQKFNTWQHAEIAETLGDCGMLCYTLGDLSHAEGMLRTAVGVWRQLLDRTQPKLAAAVLELAGLFAAKERSAEAEELYQQGTSLLREASDGSLQLYRALNRLALLHRQRGKPEVAVPLLRECIAGVEQALGKGDHLATAALRHNLALCLMAMHGTSSERAAASAREACEMLEKVAAVYQVSLPPSSPSALALQRSLAQCYLQLKRPDSAAPLLDKALHITEELGTYSAREVGRLRFLLGQARMLQGKMEESRRHFEWVLRHPAAAASINEKEREAAEELVRRPRGSSEAGAGPADKEEPGEQEPAEEEAPRWESSAEQPSPLRARATSCTSEPQGEPESLAEGPCMRDGRHLGFVDVEETSLSILNRVQYLLADRVEACLGVLPPLGDGHHIAAAETGGRPPGPEAEAGSLAALLPRMELVCLRLPSQ